MKAVMSMIPPRRRGHWLFTHAKRELCEKDEEELADFVDAFRRSPTTADWGAPGSA